MVNLHAVISPIQVTLVILDYLYLLVLIICLSPLIHMVGLKVLLATQSFMQMYVSVIRQMSKMQQDTLVKVHGFLKH